ncbi:MAG: hypothetical protein IH987_16725 [Planctomycetes bacterium]|nr:hypothetical protein [Planctomycetota bacterium]
MTVGTYNIRIAGFGRAFDDWVNTRRHQVFMSIEANNGASDHKPLYADVTRENLPEPVPAASSWGLLSLTLLLLATGSIVIQKDATNSSGSSGRPMETGVYAVRA